MNEKRTSIFENGLIWFGAGVSLAEILTGTYFAPLGFGKGVLAIIIGHIIGCMMLCRSNWWKDQTKCNGNSKNEFWREGRNLLLLPECAAAGWLDSDYDL